MTGKLTLLDVLARTVPPAPWEDGDNIPWDEPGFSARMLGLHLSQAHDLSSRRLGTIDRQVEWLHRTVLAGQPGRVLDLGCGPGLYTERLARLGHRCVGIDFSPASVAHARARAAEEGLAATYLLEDLRQADPGDGFDLATLLYGQLNVFRRAEATALLARARSALVPGGRLVLEPQTAAFVRGSEASETSWVSAETGLFSDRPHLLLHESAWDEASATAVERWHVIDVATGAVERHALSTVAWTSAELEAVLGELGFAAVEVLPRLPGSALDSPMTALVATV